VAVRFTVGIDLGTSNCAVAFVELKDGTAAAIADLPIRQSTRPGEVAPRALLPSFLYLPAAGEFPDGALFSPAHPGPQPNRVAGELARWQGARVPGRQVASAKSWLCHAGVDRQAPILPWGAATDVERLSPVDAQAELLTHLVATPLGICSDSCDFWFRRRSRPDGCAQ
jgi:molecular chaperone DnaK (HSP70)